MLKICHIRDVRHISDFCHMNDFCHICAFDRNFRKSSKLPKILKISRKTEFLVEFWTGVSDLSFGKIFGKFRETFGGPKALFIFGTVSTVGIPVRSIFAKGKRTKIFGQLSTLQYRTLISCYHTQPFSYLQSSIR